jgi:hypothetical protein
MHIKSFMAAAVAALTLAACSAEKEEVVAEAAGDAAAAEAAPAEAAPAEAPAAAATDAPVEAAQ